MAPVNVTTLLRTEIAKWIYATQLKRFRKVPRNLRQQVRRFHRLKARLCINRIIDALLKADKLDATYFVFDDQSIVNICIATLITSRSLDDIDHILQKLRGICSFCESDALMLVSEITRGICGTGIYNSKTVNKQGVTFMLCYLTRLIDFGIAKQTIADAVYGDIIVCISNTSSINADPIMSLVRSLKESSFIASAFTIYEIFNYINDKLHSFNLDVCLTCLELGEPDCSALDRAEKECIFDRSIMNASCYSVVRSLCRLRLLPDSLYVVNALMRRVRYVYQLDGSDLFKTLQMIITHRPDIIPIIAQLQIIVDRYVSFQLLGIQCYVLPEYILAGIDDDHTVKDYDGIMLYGIQWNLVTHQLARICHISQWHRGHHLRVEALTRFRRLFSQCLQFDYSMNRDITI